MAKRISERDYIVCTNLAKLRIAFAAIKDLSEGNEYGVPESELAEALGLLSGWLDALEKLVTSP